MCSPANRTSVIFMRDILMIVLHWSVFNLFLHFDGSHLNQMLKFVFANKSAFEFFTKKNICIKKLYLLGTCHSFAIIISSTDIFWNCRIDYQKNIFCICHNLYTLFRIYRLNYTVIVMLMSAINGINN